MERHRLYVIAPGTMSQLTVMLPFPGTASTPVGETGGGSVADSVTVMFAAGRPLEDAVRVIEPGTLVDWTSTCAKPLNKGICVPLSASCDAGLPLPTPMIEPPLTLKVTVLLAVGIIFP